MPAGDQDLLEVGEGYHVTGALRIKPGRGDRTLSMSCSDKLMKWCVVGIQGGLLANFLKTPIYLSSLVISSGEFNSEAIYRALSLRVQDKSDVLKLHTPSILQSKILLPDRKEVAEKGVGCVGSITPAGTGIII